MVVLADRVEAAAEALGGPTHVGYAAKEILHYDILAAMQRAGFLDRLVFHGGTALRLCYGAARLSEDLDFSGGKRFEPASFSGLGYEIQQAVGRSYAGEIGMKHAKGLDIPGPRSELCTSKWELRVPMRPRRPDIPIQRVKIEITNVDAFKVVTLPVLINHDCVPDELRDIRIRVSTREEILADKLVSLPEAWAAHATNLRYRDIWDIGWLAQMSTPLNKEWVAAKRAGYAGSGGIEAAKRMADRAESIASSPEFVARMEVLLPEGIYAETIAQPGFTERLGAACSSLLREVAESSEPASPFDMPDPFAPPSPFSL